MIWCLLVSCLALLGCPLTEADTTDMVQVATCDMQPNPRFLRDGELYQDVHGTAQFWESEDGAWVEVRIDLQGFNTSDADVSHGTHVHNGNNITEQCEDSGSHFNPFHARHGGPGTAERHVGDLGNLVEDAAGNVVTTIRDDVIKFSGIANISGRTFDVHESIDDLLPTGFGNNGPRLACCIITMIDREVLDSTASAPSINSVTPSLTIVIIALLALFL